MFLKNTLSSFLYVDSESITIFVLVQDDPVKYTKVQIKEISVNPGYEKFQTQCTIFF